MWSVSVVCILILASYHIALYPYKPSSFNVYQTFELLDVSIFLSVLFTIASCKQPETPAILDHLKIISQMGLFEAETGF